MSLSWNFPLGTKTYQTTQSYPTSTIRSEGSSGVNVNDLMTVSHEKIKSSGKVSSVLIFDHTIVPTATDVCTSESSIRALLKVQFDPLDGRTTTEADITTLLEQIAAFIAVPDNVSRFLNQEH